jgi:hypothetical protein
MRRLLRTITALLVLALVFVVARGDLFRTTVAVTTSLPTVPICTASQFQAKWVDGTAGAGTAYAWITFTNIQETCSMPTWIDLVMGTDSNSVANSFARVTDLTEMTKPDGGPITESPAGITLGHQQSASLAISFSNRSGCAAATAVTASWLRGGMEPQKLQIPATYLVLQCNGPSAFVSPVFR